MSTMQPIHLAIGLVEGLITAAVLCFVQEARPEFLWGADETENTKEGRFSYKSALAVLAVATVIIAGGLSLLASQYPDGLEWSMEKVAGTAELEANGGIYDIIGSIQNITSVLPDYAFKNSQSAIGTSLSGLVGAVIVLGVCVAACYIFKFFKRKNNN